MKKIALLLIICISPIVNANCIDKFDEAQLTYTIGMIDYEENMIQLRETLENSDRTSMEGKTSFCKSLTNIRNNTLKIISTFKTSMIQFDDAELLCRNTMYSDVIDGFRLAIQRHNQSRDLLEIIEKKRQKLCFDKGISTLP